MTPSASSSSSQSLTAMTSITTKELPKLNQLIELFQKLYEENLFFRGNFKAAKENWEELREKIIQEKQWMKKNLPKDWERNVLRNVNDTSTREHVARWYKLSIFPDTHMTVQLFKETPYFKETGSLKLPAKVARQAVLACQEPIKK